MSADTVTALLLIVAPIVFNVAFAALGRAFDSGVSLLLWGVTWRARRARGPGNR